MKSFLNSSAFARSGAYACFFAVLLLLFNTQANAQQSKLPLNQTSSTPWVNGSSPLFTVNQTNSTTGTGSWDISCGFLCSTSSAPKVIDSDLSNFAEGSITLTGSVSIKVGEVTPANTYSAGNFVGFLVKNSSVLGVTLLGATTIKTYLNGTLQETSTSSSILGLSTTLVAGATEVGIYTTKPYNQVEISLTSPVTLLTTYDVYYAVQRAYKAGPALDCNTPTAANFPLFPTIVNPVNTGTTLVGTVTNSENAVDATTTNAASLSITAIGSAFLSVKDQVTDYPANTFAGFDIENTSVANLGVFNNITLKTYLNGTLKETKNASNGLVSIGLLSSSGRQRVGFITSQAFDEIQITVEALVNVNLGATLVYNAVFETFCNGPQLTCNTPTALTSPTYPVTISAANTGITGVACVNCQVTETGNLIDANAANHADIVLTAGLGVSGSIAVKSVGQTYPAGTFAGFDINTPSVIGVGVLSGLRIETYLNGAATGDVYANGSLLGTNVPLLSGSGRQVIGFLTAHPFDEIKLTVNQTAGVTVGTTEVYGAIFTRFCAGTNLACNTLTSVTNPAFPVFVDGKNTGITSTACVACTVNNSGNAIDGDPASAATIVLTTSVASSGTFAVANAVDTYLATSFAGFDVETTTLLSAGALSNATISLYNDGALVQTGTGDALIVGAASSLLTGTTRQIVGLVATVSYDEVKITFNQLAGANLGNIKIYGAVFDKLCQGTIACNNSFLLTQPEFPVVINSARTGVSGAVCALCNVQDAWNVITASKTDFAQVSVAANVGATASISVVDPISTYPAGTTAGFTIRNVNNLVELDLLNSITIQTYNNGVLQETKVGSALLNLNLLNIVTVGTGTVINPSFVTTKPFDEIRISFAALASVINVVNVFGAFVDTRGTVSGGALSCNIVYNPDFNVTQINVPVTGNVSTNDKVPTGTTYGPTATAGGSNPAGAVFTLNPDGTYTFTATAVGVYTFQVPVCVPDLGCTNVPLTITVTDPAINTNKPVANTDIAVLTGAPTTPSSATINIKANDGPGNAGGVLGTPTIATPPAHGTASIDGSGNAVYTPTAGYYGDDSFTYTVCETPGTNLCATATVYLTVKQPGGTNTTSASDDYVSTAAGITATGNVSTNDTDPEGNTHTVTTQTVSNAKGVFTLLADGSFTFVPATGITGPVDFIYTTCDNGTPSACATATLHVLVKAPVTVLTNPDFNVTQINVPVPGNVSTNDKVPAGTTYGTPTPGGSNPAGGGAITLNTDGSYTFTGTIPGVYTYDVPVCVPGVTPCGSAPLVITVTNPKITNPPVANTDIASTTGAASTPSSVTINVKANDGPGNTGGTLGDPVPSTPAHGTVSVLNGNVVYTPAAGYYGPDMFTYSVCETPGTNLCATATVYITVKQPGTPNSTTAADDYVSTLEGVNATGNVSTNDTDPEGNALIVTPQTISNSNGTLTLLADGSFTFVPAAGFTGPLDFTYTTCDNGTPSACASATLHLLVIPKLPDLTATITMADGTFAATESKNFVVNLIELNNKLTNDQASFTISVPPGFRIETFDNTISTIIPAGGTSRNVQNTNWHQVSKTNTNILVKANTGTNVGPGPSTNRASLGFTVTRTSATKGSTGNITVVIVVDPTKDNDSVTTNNTILRIITNQ